MIFGITNNILAFIVRKIGKRIDFHSVNTQSAFVFSLTFGIMFMNNILLSAVLLPWQLKYGQSYFYFLYGRMILLTLVTTNIMPYLLILIDLLVNKCCRKRARSVKQF